MFYIFSPAKPADLVALETEGNQMRSGRYWEAHFKTGAKPGQVLLIFRVGRNPAISRKVRF